MGSAMSRFKKRFKSPNPPSTQSDTNWNSSRLKCLPSIGKKSRIFQIFKRSKAEPSLANTSDLERQYEQQRAIAMKAHLESNVQNNTPTPTTPSSNSAENDQVSPVIRHSTRINRHVKRQKNQKWRRP